MKILFALMLSFISMVPFTAHSFQIQGLGQTYSEASIDAQTALLALNGPRKYVADKNNSPMIDCNNVHYAPHESSNGVYRCDYKDPNILVKVTIPVVEIIQ
jgi:hypothetical protein